jgi:hypothetical protein
MRRCPKSGPIRLAEDGHARPGTYHPDPHASVGVADFAPDAVMGRLGAETTHAIASPLGDLTALVAAGISVWKRYVLGVFLAFHRQPDFDALRALAPNAIGGLAAGLVLGWLCGLLWQYRLAPVRARP